MPLPAVPALRQPKFVTRPQENLGKMSNTNVINGNSVSNTNLSDVRYVIVTLKDEKKLVVSSDAYHGVITVGEMYKCVFCQEEMELNSGYKEGHINSKRHLQFLQKYAPAEEYAENLIRKLTVGTSFCTICNVVVSNVNLTRHLHTEVHTQELQKAGLRANIYKPS